MSDLLYQAKQSSKLKWRKSQMHNEILQTVNDFIYFETQILAQINQFGKKKTFVGQIEQ